MKFSVKYIIIIVCVALSYAVAAQQKNPLAIARLLLSQGQVDSAIAAYQYAYQDEPFSQKIYDEYLGVLRKEQRYDAALTLIDYMSKIKRGDVGIVMDKAQILELQGEKKSARKLVDQMIEETAAKGEYDVRKAVAILEDRKHYKEAIAILELSKERIDPMLRSAIAPDNVLGRLYLLSGDVGKGLPIFLQQIAYDPTLEADFKARLLTLMDQDKSYKDKVTKELNNLLKDKTISNATIVQTLAWLDQSSGKQADAIESLIAIDKKDVGSQENELVKLGAVAAYEGQYADAMKVFDYLSNIANTSDDNKLKYRYQYLRNAVYEIDRKRPVDVPLVNKTAADMQQFFTQHPAMRTDAMYIAYTDIMAKHLQQSGDAILLLQSVIDSMRPSKDYVGYAKIALGDYHLFTGKVWDANLYYAQVDKLFRQDMIGEEARYKQAKVAYYRGDFPWAQQSLNILKASTTENISNDAMQLSIVITENTADDTTALPLKEYAMADLLIYQQQYDTATALLQSMLERYPDHALVDDILMLLGKIAKDEGEFTKAINYYQQVLDKYKDDVLADDAMLHMAHIYYHNLKDAEKARTYYENVIIDFPQSTLVATARAMLAKMDKGDGLSN